MFKLYYIKPQESELIGMVIKISIILSFGHCALKSMLLKAQCRKLEI